MSIDLIQNLLIGYSKHTKVQPESPAGVMKGASKEYSVRQVVDNIADIILKVIEFVLFFFESKESAPLVSTEASSGQEEIEDGFNLMDDSGAPVAQEWEKAVLNLSRGDYLIGSTVKAYGDFLKARSEGNHPFILVEELLFPTMLEANSALVKQKINEALNSSENNKPVLIPLILESKHKSTKLIGNLFPVHIVILALDPKNRTIEYYNSQGGALADESRKILGLDIPANQFIDYLDNPSLQDWTSKHNSEAHQKDHVNCGAFVCLFMKQKANNQSFLREGIDIKKERRKLANDLAKFNGQI